MRLFPARRDEGHLVRANPLATAEPPLDAQAIWFELSRRDWTSLALVPVGTGLSAMPAAIALSQVCAALQGPPLSILSGEEPDLALLSGLVEELSIVRVGDAGPERIVVPVASILDHPPAVAIARAADCAVLCIELHKTSIADARRAIALVGAERWLGYLVLGGGKP